MKHQFYQDNQLLFSLEDAAEYDTATPYRYAVSRFTEVANLIHVGQSVTVLTQDSDEQVVLQTVEQLLIWITRHFSGLEAFVP